MTFLATYWWAFLVGTGVFAGLAGFLQLRNIRSILKCSMLTTLEAPEDPVWMDADGVDGVFSRFKGVAVCGFLAAGCGIVTVIGVIVALIEHFKATP